MFYQFADLVYSDLACCTSEVVPLLFPDFILSVELYIFMIRFLTCTLNSVRVNMKKIKYYNSSSSFLGMKPQ